MTNREWLASLDDKAFACAMMNIKTIVCEDEGKPEYWLNSDDVAEWLSKERG